MAKIPLKFLNAYKFYFNSLKKNLLILHFILIHKFFSFFFLFSLILKLKQKEKMSFHQLKQIKIFVFTKSFTKTK